MSSEPWILTITRLYGLRFLRPEKSWRPVVTVVVDHHPEMHVLLGCDGQNINMKEQFLFRDVDVDSRIDIQVWRKSESKKKGKKRQLTASTSLTLGELLKIQGAFSHTQLHLNCMNIAGKRTAKGQPQKCATLGIRLRAPSPPSLASSSKASQTSDEDHDSCSNFSGRASNTLISDDDESQNHPLIPISDEPHNLLRRRRVQGYTLDSGDESSIGDEYPYEDQDSSYLDDRTWDDECENEDGIRVVRFGPMSWIASQILPRYADQTSSSLPLSRIEAFINRFSPYQQMKDAISDAEFQDILNNLKAEWRWGMNILMALCGLNATVFGFSPDILFSVNSPAKRAVAVSGVSAGIALVLNFWYQFLYSGATGTKFQHQARDTFGTYFFFCLCCRLPTFLMVVSSCALLGFMLLVSFRVWPQAVIFVAFFAGVLITLQYLLFGAHKLILGIRWMFKRIGVASAYIWRVVTFRSGANPAPTTNDPITLDLNVGGGEKDDGIVVTVKMKGVDNDEDLDEKH